MLILQALWQYNIGHKCSKFIFVVPSYDHWPYLINYWIHDRCVYRLIFFAPNPYKFRKDKICKINYRFVHSCLYILPYQNLVGKSKSFRQTLAKQGIVWVKGIIDVKPSKFIYRFPPSNWILIFVLQPDKLSNISCDVIKVWPCQVKHASLKCLF